MEKVIKARLKNFFSFICKKTGKQFDYHDISVKFTRNLPVDLATTAQIITQLQNTISQETALSLLNFVENPKVEIEKFKKEKELYEGIDLEKILGEQDE